LYSLIESTKLNGVNPQHRLADVLAPSPAKRIDQLLPRDWKPADETRAAARTGAFTERLLCFPPRPRNSTSESRNIACPFDARGLLRATPKKDVDGRCWHQG
jgi:hypothetical protein